MSNLHRPFRSVLIANRGEIASRVVQEAQERGLKAVAVYSEADRDAHHVWLANEAVLIGPAPAPQSYLRGDAILSAAKATKVEAVHPGYGFLAENPDFAQAVIDAGLVWIGPSPAAIRAMGNKGEAKRIALKADVPLIPGYQGTDQSDERLAKEAAAIGWPVMIKAANGGGGRGMRRVEQAADFSSALASARREAMSAFGSDEMILEKALDGVRHVEVQVFGDSAGNVIHLGERDCSVQRRNQKIIEEAPCPVVTPELRARMGEAAVRLAGAVGYANAGTVEFLLDGRLNFYFLEMNTRIQVEHPVTEEVTGLNLIQWQFDVAEGKPLPLKQGEVRIAGHAIEARLCAEDPAAGFKPETGTITSMRGPINVKSRVDGEFMGKTRIGGHYYLLLAKVIARGETREEARLNLINALENCDVRGIKTNRNFLIDLLQRPAFANGEIDIGWLSREPQFSEDHVDGLLGDVAGIFLARGKGNGWRSTGAASSVVVLRERSTIRTLRIVDGVLNGRRIGEVWRHGEGPGSSGAQFMVLDGDRTYSAHVYCDGTIVHVHCGGRDATFEDITYAPAEQKGGASDGVLRAPMDGKIGAVRAAPGVAVKKGEVLVVLEAMKMEHEIVAAADGTVESVSAKAGDQVSTRQVLVTLAQTKLSSRP